MKKWLKRLLTALIFFALSISLFRVSNNALKPPVAPEKDPWRFGGGELIADIGGLGLSYEEFRWHASRALTEGAGISPALADLRYDESLIDFMIRDAMDRAAYWRALDIMAMEEGIEAPQPGEQELLSLLRRDYMTESVARSLLRAQTLERLLMLRRGLPDGQEALLWGESQGLLRFRALWLSADSRIYSSEEIQGRLEQLELFARLIDQGQEDFEELCRVYSEDLHWAEGQQYLPGGGPEPLLSAVRELAAGKSTALIAEEGVWLLQRLDPTAEETVLTASGSAGLRQLAAQAVWEAELEAQVSSLSRSFRRRWKYVDPAFLF